MASTDPPPVAQGGEDTLSPSAVNRVLMELLISVGKTLVVVYPVYLTGYLGLSISWVLLCMLMVTWWRKNRVQKFSRIGSAIDFVDNEKQVIDTELSGSLQMASWVSHCHGCAWSRSQLEVLSELPTQGGDSRR